jgi:hypothetical protein
MFIPTNEIVMKQKQKFSPLTLLFILLLMCSSYSASAQITLPGDVDDEPAMPIDGMLGLGVAAGLYYGVRKARQHKK